MMEKNFDKNNFNVDSIELQKGYGLTHAIFASWKPELKGKKVAEIEAAFRKESLETRNNIIDLAKTIESKSTKGKSNVSGKTIFHTGKLFIKDIINKGEKLIDNVVPDEKTINQTQEDNHKKPLDQDEIKQENVVNQTPSNANENKEEFSTSKLDYLKNNIPLQTTENDIDKGKNTRENTLKCIEQLSVNPEFQQKVINFMYEAIKAGHKITIWESTRTQATQDSYVKKGWSKTRNSQHIQNNAIDIRYDGKPQIPLVIRQIAAKHGLWNGAEMWNGFDEPHFQPFYTGDEDKKEQRLLAMKKRGTLPATYSA